MSRRSTPRHRAPRAGRWRVGVVAAALVAVSGSLLGARTTLAAFTDSSAVTTGSFTAFTLAAPTSVSCSETSNTRAMTITTPNAGERYRYVARIYSGSTQVGSDRVLSTGTPASTTYQGSDVSGLTIGATYQVRVYAQSATSTSWEASSYKAYSFRLTNLANLVIIFTCVAAL